MRIIKPLQCQETNYSDMDIRKEIFNVCAQGITLPAHGTDINNYPLIQMMTYLTSPFLHKGLEVG